VPYEFKYYFLLEEFMQIPSYELIQEVQAVSGSLAQQIEHATKTIGDLNTMAHELGLDVQLKPNNVEIEAKLKNDAAYWSRTGDLNYHQLAGIKTWLEGKIDSAVRSSGSNVIYLIIDFQNVFGCLQDFVGRIRIISGFYDTHDYRKCMMELADILRSKVEKLHQEHRAPIGIILCAQNHNLAYNPDFYNLIALLNYCCEVTGYRDGIIVIPTHNRSEFDDFMVAVAGDILNKKIGLKREPYYILTSDQLRDLWGINIQLAHRISIDNYLLYYYGIDLRRKYRIMSPIIPLSYISKFKDELKATNNYVNYRNELQSRSEVWRSQHYPLRPLPRPSPASSSRPTPYSRPPAFSRRRSPSGGGSFKSRKSRKRRKINKKNYSQKHKTTIKAHRKYSKKHRTYKKQKHS
jgi:hypothetical protein